MIKLPYGLSNFDQIISNNYIYIDRTSYIEALERLNARYLFFLRPRRFGKSLFLSLLEYYYGIHHKDKFEQLFRDLYIGKHPTPDVSQYLILKFDFSQIETDDFQSTRAGFLRNVKHGSLLFMGHYAQYYEAGDTKAIQQADTAMEVLQIIYRKLASVKNPPKIYLLIDEYDHFANEILSFHADDFVKMVGRNGFVRKFYETIKVGTQNGWIDRIFVTGVSPITLDSLTSGFNIATNITLEESFNAMLGFQEAEVATILEGISVPTEQIQSILQLMRQWYNGYKFAKSAAVSVYNSDMVLYFADEYAKQQRIPERLLDINIANDYQKIRKIFKINQQEKKHFEYLNELLVSGSLQSELVYMYQLEKGFNRTDFISLLYYFGIVTIAGHQALKLTFRMPNYVIKELYYQYFYQVITERASLIAQNIDVSEKVMALGYENNIVPLIELVQAVLVELSNRDKMNFDEKYLKTIFTSMIFTTSLYHIKNELEVKKSASEKGYLDLLLAHRPPLDLKYQIAIELKYVKKTAATAAAKLKVAAVKQLKSYLEHDEYLQSLSNLKAYAIVFVGNEAWFEELNISE
ncbi:MAG: AAA family ATPase [Bacteroidota bacterium]